MSKCYGYIRAITKKEIDEGTIYFQLNEIFEKYPKATVYEEEFIKTAKNKPRLKKLLEILKEDDILIVSELGRLTTDINECIELVRNLFERNITLYILNVGAIKSKKEKEIFLQTLISIVNMEKFKCVEKTQEGKEIAKKQEGFKDGRPKKFSDEEIQKALSMLATNGGEYSYKRVCEITGISKSTLIRRNKQFKEMLKI